ncbi:MAG: nitroreductase family deazaflavin-dependent oxidoreductase [Actinomycetota bacterium]
MRELDGERFCYVTTTGRRTGKPHTIEIWYAAHDRTLYLLMGGGERADTVRNLRAGPRVRVRLGDETFEASARVVEDADEAARARTLVPRKYAHEEDGLDEWAQSALPVAIDLP